MIFASRYAGWITIINVFIAICLYAINSYFPVAVITSIYGTEENNFWPRPMPRPPKKIDEFSEFVEWNFISKTLEFNKRLLHSILKFFHWIFAVIIMLFDQLLKTKNKNISKKTFDVFLSY